MTLSNLFSRLFIVVAISACSASVDSGSSASASAQAKLIAAPLTSAMQFDVELHTDAKQEDIDVFILALKNRGFVVDHTVTATSTAPAKKHIITGKHNGLLPKAVIDAMTEELEKMAPEGKFSHSFSASQPA